jgi:hypothetical protein
MDLENVKQKLIELGGNYWNRYGKKRIYFDRLDLARFTGLEFDTYKSGNVASATLDGEKISNAKARNLLRKLDSQFFFDLDDGEFHYHARNRHYWNQKYDQYAKWFGMGVDEFYENIIEIIKEKAGMDR